MLLNDYLEKLKEGELKKIKKPWLSSQIATNELFSNIYPNYKTEEWKNFNLKSIIGEKLKILDNNISFKTDAIDKTYNNLIVFNNGVFDENLSENKLKDKINIYKIQEYKKKDKSILKKIYSDFSKYSEKRLSGFDDNDTIKLLSLNAILSEGLVIEILPETVIDDPICIYNHISSEETLINPYLLIIARKKCEVKFLDLTNYIGKENWTNFFYEVYLEDNSDFQMSNLALNHYNNVNTSSYNFHLEKDSSLQLSLINKGNSKKDIRVFLNGKNAKTRIKGMLLSKQKETSDVFCKVTHNALSSASEQDWRMISSDSSKTSLSGKIKILKDSKNSSGSFFSKSLLLNEKAKSFSKPELEIFEDDVSCSHGASFGEIEKEKVFYLQSRGLSKKDAIRILVLAFINELGFNDNNLQKNIILEIERIFS